MMASNGTACVAAKGSPASVRHVLQGGQVLEISWMTSDGGSCKVASNEAASGSEFHNKFSADPQTFALAFGGLDAFYKDWKA